MKRTIVTIDEELCNGCGECVTACAEGALQMVDGKARLVKEDFCDGFGDCIGECPTGALKIEVREAPEYDPEATRRHVATLGGEAAVRRFDEAAQRHEPADPAPAPAARPVPPLQGGCPGSRMRSFGTESDARPAPIPAAGALPTQINRPELRQWPIQLHLVQAGAPFFRDRELVVMSTCAPLASADMHLRFLRGRSVVVACPKLDRTEGYVEKLAAILSEPSIPRVLVVRMEVPCCAGLTALTEEAVRLTGRPDLAADEVTVTLDGNVLA